MDEVGRTPVRPVSSPAPMPDGPVRSGSPAPGELARLGLPTVPPSDAVGAAGTGWLDRLVELHVLAAHGDLAAAAEAQQWIGHDEAAGRVWRQIDQDCALLGAIITG